MVLLSLALPLAIELVLEWFSASAPLHATTGSESGTAAVTGTEIGSSSYVAMNRHELVLFLIGICIVPILAFFPEDTANLGQLYLCFSKCQLALVGGVYMIWLCRFNQRYWTPLSTVLVLMTIMIHTSFLVFADNVIALNPNVPPPILYV